MTQPPNHPAGWQPQPRGGGYYHHSSGDGGHRPHHNRWHHPAYFLGYSGGYYDPYDYDDDYYPFNYYPDSLYPLYAEQAQDSRIERTQQDRINSIENQLSQAVSNRLDNFAKTRNYKTIDEAVTYADSTIPKYKLEGTRAKLLRDKTWAKVDEVVASVLSGTIQPPKSFADIEDNFPTLMWE